MPNATKKSQGATTKSATRDTTAEPSVPAANKPAEDQPDTEAANSAVDLAVDDDSDEECEEQRQAREHLELINDRYVARMLVTVDPVKDWQTWCSWLEQANDGVYTAAQLAVMAQVFGSWFGNKEGISLETVIGKYMPILFESPR